MAGVGAQTFTFQLSSKTAEKTGSGIEQYRLALEPAVSVPYLAQPRCQLEQFAFTNTLTNVDAALYGNNTIVFKWSPFVADTAVTPSTPQQVAKSYTLTLPDGHYSLTSLEQTIARILFKETNNGPSGHLGISATSGLWNDMAALVGAEPEPAGDDKDGNSVNTFTPAGTASNTYTGNYMWLTTVPGQHHVGGAIAGYNDRRICSIQTNAGALNGAPAGSKSRVTFDGTLKEGSDHPKGATTVDFRQVSQFDASQLTALGIQGPPHDFMGFGAGGIANPSIDPTSGWGEAIDFDELSMIADADNNNNAIAPDRAHATVDPATGDVIEEAQSQRKIHPITFRPDSRTNMLRTIVAVPLVKIDAASTLFTKTLGYSVFSDQNMLAPLDSSLTYESKAWTATNPALLLRTKAIEFHCPTLVNTSYDQRGKQSGGSLCSVPVTVAQNEVQVWQSTYDQSIPVSFHGGSIDSLTWSLTDGEGHPVNLQGQDFNATLRVSWADPVPPQIGSAGAEAEDAYGLRDVKYVS
jgi:hypothetical protein